MNTDSKTGRRRRKALKEQRRKMEKQLHRIGSLEHALHRSWEENHRRDNGDDSKHGSDANSGNRRKR